MGRKKHYKPSDDHKTLAIKMASFGITHEQIAMVLGISADTLTKFYGPDLTKARANANMIVGQTLFGMILEKNVTATIFWLKCKAGWAETQKIEMSGPDGQAQKLEFVDRPPRETREQWEERIKQKHAAQLLGAINVDSPTGPAS